MPRKLTINENTDISINEIFTKQLNYDVNNKEYSYENKEYVKYL